MSKLTVAVIFGGRSSEYEVSLVSGTTFLRGLSREKYDVLAVGITKEGRWLLYSGDWDRIPDNTWMESDCRPVYLTGDPTVGGFLAEKPDGTFETIHVDVLFPALHGKNGEDGTIQGLFQFSGIPYVGCNTLSSAVCMDKAVTNSLLEGMGIAQAHYLWFFAENYSGEGRDKIRLKIRERLGYPVFVKPANAGSSVGVSKVSCEEELDAAVEKAAREDSKVEVEEAIVGQEVECAVLGNGHPIVSGVGEIAASAEFYDYDDKYKNGTSQLYIPARLPEETAEQIRSTALRAYCRLGCSGLARVDFFVRKSDGAVLLNELNTLPGFTPISMYPKLWEAAGVPIPELLDRLIALAFERGA